MILQLTTTTLTQTSKRCPPVERHPPHKTRQNRPQTASMTALEARRGSENACSKDKLQTNVRGNEWKLSTTPLRDSVREYRCLAVETGSYPRWIHSGWRSGISSSCRTQSELVTKKNKISWTRNTTSCTRSSSSTQTTVSPSVCTMSNSLVSQLTMSSEYINVTPEI